MDVHAAEGTFLAVGCAVPGPSFRPFLELLVSSLELSARHPLVPGGVAAEAPVILTHAACDSHFVFPVALETARKFVLGDQTAVGARLPASFSSVLL